MSQPVAGFHVCSVHSIFDCVVIHRSVALPALLGNLNPKCSKFSLISAVSTDVMSSYNVTIQHGSQELRCRSELVREEFPTKLIANKFAPTTPLYHHNCGFQG
ncbi:MAG: hypothetical protein ABW185_08050 [Sedimenticola sp.]